MYGRFKSFADGKGTKRNRALGPQADADLPKGTVAALQKAWDDVLMDPKIRAVFDTYGIEAPKLAVVRHGVGGPDTRGEPAAAYADGVVWYRSRGMAGDPLSPEDIAGDKPFALDNPRSTMVHEIGHYVHERMNKGNHPLYSAETAEMVEWRRRWDAYHAAFSRGWESVGEGSDKRKIKARQNLTKRQVSYYSHQNWLEGWAETFNAVVSGADTSTLTPTGLALVEFMNAVVNGTAIPAGVAP